MNAGRRSAAGLLAMLLAAAAVPSAQARQKSAAPTPAELHELLARPDPGAGGKQRLRAELEALGPRAVPAVLRFLAGQFEAADLAPPSASERLLLESALRTWPAKEVLQALLREAQGEEPLEVLLVAMRLAGNVRDARALDALDQLCALIPSGQRQQPIVRDVLEAALEEVLRADGRALAAATELCEDEKTQASLLVPLVRALARAGPAQGLAVLERLVGREAELDLAVVDALGKLGMRSAPGDIETATGILRVHLDAADPEVRRQAAISLGRIRAAEVVPELLAFLEDSDRRVRLAGVWALERISGLALGEDPVAWEQWHERELDWYEETAPACLGALPGSDVVSGVAALQQLGEHPLFRLEFAAAVAPAVRHASAAVAEGACATLVQLGSTSALAELVGALEDPREDVRRAAHGALRALTGLALPATGEAWRGWLERG